MKYTMKYIMIPELYYSLTNIRGFTEMNGNSYKEQIIIILGEFLDEETKNKIRKTITDKEALELIPFPYTHNMDD
jgi:hypothetical protein